MAVTICSPEALSMSIEAIDKWRTSSMKRKQDEFKAICAECPADIKRACLAQGFWTNDDNKRVVLEGIFGGLTQDERKGLL